MGHRKYVGVVLRRTDELPREEAKVGRERYFGGVEEGEKETGVYEFVDGKVEGEGRFEKVREVKLVIPERVGRVEIGRAHV